MRLERRRHVLSWVAGSIGAATLHAYGAQPQWPIGDGFASKARYLGTIKLGRTCKAGLSCRWWRPREVFSA